jgi:Icc-related predicted phosphoesterase
MNDNKVLLLGDVHGESGWLKLAIRTADALEIDTILQLGDFGYWPHTGSGKVFWNEAKTNLSQRGIQLWWVDGNHENHDWIDAQPRDENGLWQDGPIVHIGRGARWIWGDGVTFLGCGGAYSIDKSWRTEGTSWWAGETISEADVIRCDGPDVDVVVTHDAPWGAANVIGYETVGDKDDYPDSAANRKRVAAICDIVKPKLLVHGHYHHRNSTVYKSSRVEGFGRDGDATGALAVLDLDTLLVHNVNPYSVIRGVDHSVIDNT